MVYLVAATSRYGHWPLFQRTCYKDGFYKRRIETAVFPSGFLHSCFFGRQIVCVPSSKVLRIRREINQFAGSSTKALATELTKQAYSFREEERIPENLNYSIDTGSRSKQWPPENKADLPSIGNPLLRQERMGCGWLGVIFEWEGVIIEDSPDLENKAWLILAEEEGKRPPPAFILNRIEGMKNEQAISEVLCWSRDPTQLRHLGSRKEEIYQSLHGDFYRIRSRSQDFMKTLMKYKVPIALVSTRPRKYLQMAMEAIGVEGSFNAVVAAEDVYRGKPDPEMFMYAAQLLNFIPERCIVFGNSNLTVEAAHDASMKCIAVAGKHPMYELGAADLVVRRLDELSIVDLKNLADIDSSEFKSKEPEPELEPELQQDPKRPVAVKDHFW